MKILTLALAVIGQILLSPIPTHAAIIGSPRWHFGISAAAAPMQGGGPYPELLLNNTHFSVIPGSLGLFISDFGVVDGLNTISFSRFGEGGASWTLTEYEHGIFQPPSLHLSGSYHCGSPGEDACGAIVPLVSFDLFGGSATAYAVPAPAMGGLAPLLLTALFFLRRRRSEPGPSV